MVPFGNFGWSFGFGFGWILIGITAILLVLGIMQLTRLSFKEEREKSEEQETFNKLKRRYARARSALKNLRKKIKSNT